MAEPCPGPCNAAWRKLPAAGQEETAPVMGEPVWCRTGPGNCTALIRRTIGDIQTLAALLEHGTDGYGEAPEHHGRNSNGHPPSPSPRHDALDEVESMLRGWEDAAWRELRYPTAPRHGYYASVSMEITADLLRHFAAIMASPFAYDFGYEVLRACRELVDRAKAGTGWKRGHVPCPRCERLGLFSIDNGFIYICTFCNWPVPKHDYQELCRAATPARTS